ncbi:putative ubiquitin-specific protease [Tupanvirus soda lake]|uniref:Ubiquitin-specific protease n=2 Tax=Tupanvirus TaxID=2094720 RepID=A0AC62ABJ7_9VIRU|nr:putative ubiquitin-specific protease [Tupanvirus soda lake]QKU35074.1 putative ubiquitin-specific protease [Tupanvirus soda lake]
MNQSDGNQQSTNTVYINSNDLPESLIQKRNAQTKEKQVRGLTGIVNVGNTCYMNSAVQALSHNYPLTYFLFTQKEEILRVLRTNARKILKDMDAFKLGNETSIVPHSLRMKIQDPSYDPSQLLDDEMAIIYNHTITAQLIRLLENMWSRNCVVIPTSFKRVFSEARDKFFYGFEQHDAEEAYSCILQKMQEELAEEKNIKFKTNKPSVQEFLSFKNEINTRIQTATSYEEKKNLFEIYKQKKKEMPTESLTIEAYREMKKYYGSAYSRVTEIFSGFLHSSTNCPDPTCGYSSNKFDPFLHLSLPMPARHMTGMTMTIDDCINEYCKEETLDEQNLWLCEGCNNKVRAIKRLQLWTAPPVLVIQFKRFGVARISKDSRMIRYPMEHFDVSPIVSPAKMEPGKCYKYRLQCVVNHTGGLHGGHYYTYCLDEDTNKWYKFDDSHVSEISEDSIVTNTAYLLFYMREDMIKDVDTSN